MPELEARYVLRYRTADGFEWHGSGRSWAITLRVIRARRHWGMSLPIGVRRVA